MHTYDFESYAAFHSFLTGDGSRFDNKFISEFKRHFCNINKGCKCKKKQRLAKTAGAYFKLVNNIPPAMGKDMKDILGAEFIDFFHNDELLKTI